MLYSIVGMLVIILDQLVKFWVDRNINWTNPTREIIPGILSLVRVQNDGAAFSFLSGSGARIWFIVITGIFAVLVVLALATNFVSGRFGRWCLVFVTAGGLSNMIDRIRYGYVIDMFKVELFDFAVFNVADIFITVFCIAFIIYILFGGEKRKDEYTDEFDDYDDEDYDRPVRSSGKKRTSRRYEDEDEEERYDSRRPSRKRSSKYYDEEEYEDEEEVPGKRAERSAAAAAKAYSRAPSADMPPLKGQRSGSSAVNDVPVDRQSRTVTEPQREVPRYQTGGGRVRRETEEETQPAVRTSRRAAPQAEEQAVRPVRRAAAQAQVEEQTVRSTRRAVPQSEEPAAGRTVRSSAVNDVPVDRQSRTVTEPRREVPRSSDSSNPFAEWEQANERVSSGRTFTDLSAESSGKVSAPRTSAVKSESVKAAPANSVGTASDNFDLDAILNEFK